MPLQGSVRAYSSLLWTTGDGFAGSVGVLGLHVAQQQLFLDGRADDRRKIAANSALATQQLLRCRPYSGQSCSCVWQK